jgi:hypothetical protein
MAAKLTRLTEKIAIQLNLIAGELYHLKFSFQAASPETFGYNLVQGNNLGLLGYRTVPENG